MTSELFAGAASWNWQIGRSLSLTSALRLDSIEFARGGAELYFPGLGRPFGDRRYTEPSYNSMLLYKVSDYDTIRLGTGRALQLPSLFSYGFQARVGPVNVLGSRHLDPSAVTNYELGYERRLPTLGSVFSLSLFHQDTDKTIGTPFGSGFSRSPDGAIYLAARNFGGSRATGGEVAIDGASTTGWRWHLGYALASLEDESPAAALRQAPSVAYEAQTPVHAITGGLGFTWRSWEVDTAAKWQSGFTDFRSTAAAGRFDQLAVPDYLTMNARIGYHFSEAATLSLTAEQANAGKQTQTAGRDVERRLLVGLTIEF